MGCATFSLAETLRYQRGPSSRAAPFQVTRSLGTSVRRQEAASGVNSRDSHRFESGQAL